MKYNSIISALVMCCWMTVAALADPPLNDDCINADNAGTLSSGYAVQLSGVTDEATLDCQNLEIDEVWIKFTISDYMEVTIDFCDNSTQVDLNSLCGYLFSECPCGTGRSFNIENSCPNNSSSLTWQYLPAGTYYYPVYNTFQLGGSYTINILGIDSSAPPTGACCSDGGMACEVIDQYTCVYSIGGTWKGEGTDCGTYDEETGWSSCQGPPTGACCYFNGMECIEDQTEEDCVDGAGGTWMGEGSECGTFDGTYWSGCDSQPPITGACCVNGGVICYDAVTQDSCGNYLAGTWMGEGSECGAFDENYGMYEGCYQFTPPTGACCYSDGAGCAENQTEEDCVYGAGGTWMGEGSECGEYDDSTGMYEGCQQTTPPTGACCAAGGTVCVENQTEEDCVYGAGGTWMGEGSECGTFDGNYWSGCDSQPITGACCVNDGVICYDAIMQDSCENNLAGTWMGVGSECGAFDENYGRYEGCQQITPPTGACCYSEGAACLDDQTEEDCVLGIGGTWMGEGSECGEYDDNTGMYEGCQQTTPPTGACCYSDGAGCLGDQTEEDCVLGIGGTWMGEGSECGEYDDNTGMYEGCQQGTNYDYLPGDANMSAGAWPPMTIGGDVTYLVSYFRGITPACRLDGFYASADANGSCSVTGADVTKLVSYFRGMDDLSYCPDYPTTWPPIPDTAPDGWPNCASPVLSK